MALLKSAPCRLDWSNEQSKKSQPSNTAFIAVIPVKSDSFKSQSLK